MVNLIPNYLTHPAIVVGMAKRYLDQFIPRIGGAAHGGPLPVLSRFSTLQVDQVCPKEDIALIFANSMFPDDVRKFYQFIQIQWYKPGEFIVPHQDTYAIQQLHLITLTTSDADGLIVQDGDTLIRVPDIAGTKVEMAYDAWHWVDPVAAHRFSLVVGI